MRKPEEVINILSEYTSDQLAELFDLRVIIDEYKINNLPHKVDETVKAAIKDANGDFAKFPILVKMSLDEEFIK